MNLQVIMGISEDGKGVADTILRLGNPVRGLPDDNPTPEDLFVGFSRCKFWCSYFGITALLSRISRVNYVLICRKKAYQYVNVKFSNNIYFYRIVV